MIGFARRGSSRLQQFGRFTGALSAVTLAVVGIALPSTPAAAGQPTITIDSPLGQDVAAGSELLAAYACTADEGAEILSCTATVSPQGAPEDAVPVENGAALDTTVLGPFVVTVTATDTSGESAQASSGFAVVVDVTPPVVTGTPSVQPNAAGWYTSDLSIAWSVSDPEPSAGLPGAVADTPVLDEGADLTITSPPACDAAGNCAQGSVSGLNVDRTPPVVTITGVTDGATYRLGEVPTPGCQATDVVSGVDAVGCVGQVTGGEPDGTGDYTYTATAHDEAGNGTTVTASYLVEGEPAPVDTTAPVVTGVVVETPNPAGWFTTDVTVQWTVTDPDPSSGLVAMPADTVVTGEGADLTATSAEVCDGAGNCGTGVVSGINIDRTAPTVTLTGVEEGAEYLVSEVPAVTCEAVDGLSGVVGECVVSGYGTAQGSWTVTAEAMDAAGNVGMASVSYTVVGLVTADLLPPAITINSPAEGYRVPMGATVLADYTCADSLSGVASCSGTVANGAPVDTSALGEHTFTVRASDVAGNSASVSVVYTVVEANAQVTGTVKDVSGNLLPGSVVEARQAGTANLVASTAANTDGVYSLTLPAGTYDFRIVGPEGSGLGARVSGREIPGGVTGLDWTIGVAPVRVSGVVSDGVEPVSYGGVQIYDADGLMAADLSVGVGGLWSADLVPGVYRFAFYGSTPRVAWFSAWYESEELTADAVVNLAPVLEPVTVHLLGADGAPASGTARLHCSGFGPAGRSEYISQYINSSGEGLGAIEVWGTPTPEGYVCQLVVDPDEGPNVTRTITITPDGPNDITIFTFGSGVTIIGDPETTNDGDNVADAVEALAPNDGDGNGDGIADYQQVNVTSLPVLGGALGSGNSYVTVAAPEGTSLSNVYTIDPADTTQVASPPPVGFTLPEGLTNFVVKDAEVGSDQTISIYTASTAGVTGYAKYDPATGQWSLLSSDRVRIHSDHVDITLTDGGEGDADGVANGVIDDPGGLVIVTDRTAPQVTITGPEVGATYQVGEVPRATCSATDDMSGVSGACVISGYGDTEGTWTVTATAKDIANNVGTASVTYTVTAKSEKWDLRGFYAPVDMGGVLNTVKAGSTVPLKFEVFSGGTELTATSLIGASFTVRTMVCDTRAVEDPVEFTTTGDTSLRYDAAAGVFIQNWKTPRQPGKCYLVTVATEDGSAASASFKLK